MKNLLLLLLAITTVGFISSCDDDPVKGCTDVEAENYNPEADESDGNCSYLRDKFVGSYEGEIKCGFPLNTDTEFKLDVSEGLADKSAVEIQFKETEIQLPILKGYVEGDSIFVNKDTVRDVQLEGFPVVLDLEITGKGVLSDNGDEIEGQLSVSTIDETGQAPIVSICDFEADRD